MLHSTLKRYCSVNLATIALPCLYCWDAWNQDPKNVEAVSAWPTPALPKETQQLLKRTSKADASFT